jgi:hypothetical protein
MQAGTSEAVELCKKKSVLFSVGVLDGVLDGVAPQMCTGEKVSSVDFTIKQL